MKSLLVLFLFTIFSFSTYSKIIIPNEHRNVTADKALEALFDLVDPELGKITTCGQFLRSLPASPGEYKTCIENLKLPKIFEKHFLTMKAGEFEEGGVEFINGVNGIIDKVDKEIQEKFKEYDVNVLFETEFEDFMKENVGSQYVSKGISGGSSSSTISGVSTTTTPKSSDSSPTTKPDSVSSSKTHNLIMILIVVVALIIFASLSFVLLQKKSRRQAEMVDVPEKL